MKERLLEVLELLNHEKEDLDQLCKDVSFPETRLARSATMTNRRVREILEEVLEGIEDEWMNVSMLQSNIHRNKDWSTETQMRQKHAIFIRCNQTTLYLERNVGVVK